MPMLQDPYRRSERLLVIITDMKDTVSTTVVMADAIIDMDGMKLADLFGWRLAEHWVLSAVTQ